MSDEPRNQLSITCERFFLWLGGSKLTKEEIRERKKKSPSQASLDGISSDVLEKIIPAKAAIARISLESLAGISSDVLEKIIPAEAAITRSSLESLDKKTGWLLTLTGVLIPLSIGSVVPAAHRVPDWQALVCLLLISTVPLLLTVLILRIYIRPGEWSSVQLSKIDQKSREENQLLESYYEQLDGCTRENIERLKFLVEVYTAALRMFFHALAINILIGCVIVGLIGYYSNKEKAKIEDNTQELIKKVSSDPDLAKWLIGPKAAPGIQGERRPAAKP